MDSKNHRNRHSFHGVNDKQDNIYFRSRFTKLQRPYSMVNFVTNNERKSAEVYESASTVHESPTPIGHSLSLVAAYPQKKHKFDIFKKSWKSVVNVVLIEARDLPDSPASSTCGLYCKFRLGNEKYKSKQVSKSKPMWRERFNLHLYEDTRLEITVWHKVKQKYFMGRCVIELSQLEYEKTRDIWHNLECGFGSIHMLVTLSGTPKDVGTDNVLPTDEISHPTPTCDEFLWYRLNNGWSEVGLLSVTVYYARGLSPLGLGGKADAYCVLELDNSRVQTHTVRGAAEHAWNKSYTFDINDITSTLDIKINDESLIGETFGNISIPLLRINNNEKKWYALKDRSKKSNAKGNCPRILLQMSVAWNPIKASLRLITPKETKYMQKPPSKFNVPIVYHNLKVIRDIFRAIHIVNEHFKHIFEWENQETSTLALIAWLMFWSLFRLWMTPLLLLIPLVYNWLGHNNHSTRVSVYPTEEEASEEDSESTKDDLTIKTRLYGLQELTFTINDGIDYLVSFMERLINLLNFTVPYLSYLVMLAMVAAAAAFYFIPTNYLFMVFGIYKYTRKFLNPNRVPNNDIEDFISRAPDKKTLKQWQELKVPEPNLSRTQSSTGR